MKLEEINALRDLAKLVTDRDSTVPISKKALNELLDRPSILATIAMLVLFFMGGMALGVNIGKILH